MILDQVKMKDLSVFVTVAECGSMTAAAEKLYIAQPALSRKIHEIESMLGRQLMIRDKRGIVLTTAGQIFFEYACRILQNCSAMEDGIRRLSVPLSGEIKIGYTTSFHFNAYANAIDKFSRRYPQCSVELIECAGGRDIIDCLLNHKIDVGYCSMLYVNNHDNLEYKKIELIRNHVIVRKGTQLAKKNEISLAHIENETFFLPDPKNYPANVSLLKKLISEKATTCRIEYVDSIERLLFYVRCGRGIGFLANVVKMFEGDTLVSIPFREDTTPRYRVVAWHRENKNPGVAEFLNTFSETKNSTIQYDIP